MRNISNSIPHYCNRVPANATRLNVSISTVVYISEAGDSLAGDRFGLTGNRLDNLVRDAARFNRIAGVTGALLFDGRHFLQYMEGPEDGLSVACSRTFASKRHTVLVELLRKTIEKRHFPFWSMISFPLEPQELRVLSNAQWGRKPGTDGAAIDLMARFVQPYWRDF